MLSDLRAVLEQLADENNDQPIELINDRGERALFSQMALIPVSVPSKEYEDEEVEHNFALLQPIDENGENTGDCLVFDFVKDESGEITVELIDDPYTMRTMMEIYRQRGKLFEEENGQAETEECDSIFGGTLTEEASEKEPEENDESFIDEKVSELRESVDPSEVEKGKKKGFFGKLFGKK